ncbi:uncharacterized protein LOC127619302 [Xyrauchen texanus]|uniref:uncharacterized protein LOC127619302 n=1 Tax=Xyrauchen texanus TaxID=154827 RepID=UPI00224282D0|nr:uncharacterized protein LOC127619302 [Xyrauchen texanus]
MVPLKSEMWMRGFLFLFFGFISIYADAIYLQDNIAIKGTPVQSSTYFNQADSAIDGFSTTCTHTNTESNPWWRLDLLNVSSISRVVITNRVDCCPVRINGAEIRIGNSLDNNGNNNSRCAVISMAEAGEVATYMCAGGVMEGRYVNIVLPGKLTNLTLCEVKVYADNVALHGNAVQSSLFRYWFPRRAIDKIKLSQGEASSCSCTQFEQNPWWRLDLLDNYYVSKVVITNRADCCPERINGAEIRIGNSLQNNGNNNPRCAVIDSIPAGASYNFSCGGMLGRYVNVVIPGDEKILTLCEVEVYVILPEEKIFVRMKLQSSVDLAGPVNNKLLYQVQSALASKGIGNAKLSWSQLPQKEVKHDPEKGSCD